jgi:hypothetical protein
MEDFDFVANLGGDVDLVLPPELCWERCVNSELARLCLNELGCGETRLTAEELALRRAAAAKAIRSVEDIVSAHHSD